jgi:branched-chain amino acid transport system ATP-binding protein
VTLLEVQRVSRFFGGVAALNGVSITVGAREVVGVAGQNGAGKTTLVNVISGAFPPSSGVVRVGGQPVQGLRSHQIARLGVARTFQIPRSFAELTVEENVMVGALFGARPTADTGAAAARAREILALVGLADRGTESPATLTLAGRKRLELARALAMSPRLVLLDEVAAGLTAVETELLLQCLRTVRESGVAMIVIDHVLEVLLDLADRMYVLDHGEVIGEGTPAAVLSDPAIIAAFIGVRR